MAGEGHIRELDGVRGLSILLVLATHLLPLGPKVLQLNAMTGLMGMSLFFCLSGFLITRFLWERPDVPVFLVRRLARIYPLLALYAVVVVGIALGRWDAVQGILLTYLNYDDAILTEGTGHLWSICVELHFYFGIALAVALAGRRGFWIVPVLALVVLALRIEGGALVSIRTHLRVDEILSGSLLALAWTHRDHPLSRALQRAAAGGLWPVLGLLWLLSCHEIGGALGYARPWLTMATVAGLLFRAEGSLRRMARHPVLAWLAGISYALYIWHPAMALGWLGSGGGFTRYLVKRPITFALTFALSHLSTRFYEAWFIEAARRFGKGH
ncbi:acyltransferase family protein [Stagnihabitans tardus]|uniref:Acyltransferase family protein n=1 Tax=Stagnihabitans tardus TaxID=2699202 RepID=A0AAE4YCT6_9RHOB|nr:acyltransferase [Stagnihabitans tardus]NBZ89679.1 acyltransferase family protein [Stagnihabitans tardus]